MSTYKETCEEIYGIIDGFCLEADGATPFAARLRVLKGKLESEHFHIVVMGQFKRGKTTFINSLLGAELLPSSVVPLTSINTILRYGGSSKAIVHYLDGRGEEIAVSPGQVHPGRDKGNLLCMEARGKGAPFRSVSGHGARVYG